MTNNAKKLNTNFPVQMQGGALLVIIGMMAQKATQIEMVLQIAEAAGAETEHLEEALLTLDEAGKSLSNQAVDIFGRDYVLKIVRDSMRFNAEVVDGTLN